jgi:hypothetical protein
MNIPRNDDEWDDFRHRVEAEMSPDERVYADALWQATLAIIGGSTRPLPAPPAPGSLT